MHLTSKKLKDTKDRLSPPLVESYSNLSKYNTEIFTCGASSGDSVSLKEENPRLATVPQVWFPGSECRPGVPEKREPSTLALGDPAGPERTQKEKDSRLVSD
ncbi:hypothetical protein M8J77_006635 [Diaphorina citri]|nr:hypothetical protein M8J77_006635 [Diaphorina citri]